MGGGIFTALWSFLSRQGSGSARVPDRGTAVRGKPPSRVVGGKPPSRVVDGQPPDRVVR